MRTDQHNIIDYILKASLEEIRLCDREQVDVAVLKGTPDIVRFLQSPAGRALSQNIQLLIYVARDVARLALAIYSSSISRLTPKVLVKASSIAGSYLRPDRAEIFIDITAAVRGTVGGGIARVAFGLARAAQETARATAVYVEDGRLKAWNSNKPWPSVKFLRGDQYIIIDAFWVHDQERASLLNEVRLAGGKTAICIHDILPIDHPLLVNPDYASLFCSKLAQILSSMDTCVTVSDATKSSMIAYLRRTPLPGEHNLDVRSFKLGADRVRAYDVRSDQQLATCKEALTFLSVGTLEPKKGYPVALDAFDLLWAKGFAGRYVIVGSYGWNSRALKARIRGHSQFGKKLLWIENASDEDLRSLYLISRALIQASVAEGFGLPLIEAEAYQLPIIASDITVFREVNPAKCRYFPVCDSIALSSLIETQPPRLEISSANVESRSWEVSLETLLEALSKGEVKQRPNP